MQVNSNGAERHRELVRDLARGAPLSHRERDAALGGSESEQVAQELERRKPTVALGIDDVNELLAVVATEREQEQRALSIVCSDAGERRLPRLLEKLAKLRLRHAANSQQLARCQRLASRRKKCVTRRICAQQPEIRVDREHRVRKA